MAFACLTSAVVAEDHAIDHHGTGPIHRHHQHASESSLPVGLAFTAAWDSHYVSEGRDNLDGDGLMSAAVEITWEDLLFGVWYANSPQQSYDEWNFFVEYGRECGEFEWFVGYNHLRFPDAGGHDHEVGAGLIYNGLPWGLTPGVEAYYSFDAGGTFYEASLTREFEICEWMVLEPGIVIGFNDDYVSDGHQGANHIAAVLGCAVPISDSIELSAYLSYNWAIDRDPLASPDDFLLNDFLYGGLGLTFTF
ncbi:hypothetical protein [Haloferula sp.]|uniref:hypothetical protein n=1 Tax=Haloferula sp. TaxID=2497595 RepID=UPI00329E7356